MSDEELKQSVRKLMFHNLSEGYSKLLQEKYSYVMPSPGNYHFQWWWDTCFHVFILCAIGECDLAKKICRAFLKCSGKMVLSDI